MIAKQWRKRYERHVYYLTRGERRFFLALYALVFAAILASLVDLASRHL